jgi:hypothetical protein
MPQLIRAPVQLDVRELLFGVLPERVAYDGDRVWSPLDLLLEQVTDALVPRVFGGRVVPAKEQLLPLGFDEDR